MLARQTATNICTVSINFYWHKYEQYSLFMFKRVYVVGKVDMKASEK